MNCAFCLEPTTLTQEHLFSVPVCRAFGIDRDSSTIASLDPRTNEVTNVTTPSRRTVRLPCAACNNGWMSDLEVEMAKLASWLNGSGPLGRRRLEIAQRWMLKMLVVLGFSDLGSRRFLDEPTDVLIPDIGAAQAASGMRPIPTAARFGAARITPGFYLYAVGNPTVLPRGPDRLSSRAASVVAVNLGELQLWALVPLLPANQVRLPGSVSRLSSRLEGRRLRSAPAEPDLDAAVVVFPDVDAADLLRDVS